MAGIQSYWFIDIKGWVCFTDQLKPGKPTSCLFFPNMCSVYLTCSDILAWWQLPRVWHFKYSYNKSLKFHFYHAKLTMTINKTPSLYRTVLNLSLFIQSTIFMFGLCMAIIMEIIHIRHIKSLLVLHLYHTYIKHANFCKLL